MEGIFYLSKSTFSGAMGQTPDESKLKKAREEVERERPTLSSSLRRRGVGDSEASQILASPRLAACPPHKRDSKAQETWPQTKELAT